MLTQTQHRLAAALFACLLTLAGCGGPLGPIPGGRLSGVIHSGALPQWQFSDAFKTIQLETRSDAPHSVNTWCGSHAGSLYVPTSLLHGTNNPADRDWVKNVLVDPLVRVRIDGRVYELRAIRVENSGEMEAAREALLKKYKTEPDDQTSRAWIFRMESR